jgi:hypothetical protein
MNEYSRIPCPVISKGVEFNVPGIPDEIFDCGKTDLYTTTHRVD